MKQTHKILIAILCIAFLATCSTNPDDYKSFLKDGERIYPGSITNVFTQSGNNRIQLGWRPSPDPSVTHYVVYWNNNKDSVRVPASTHNPTDTIKAVISGLQEYTYTFIIYSFDDKGNRSVAKEVSNAVVYGPTYRNSLFNRPLMPSPTDFMTGDGSKLQIRFSTPDTVNVYTRINYTSINSGQKNIYLKSNDQAIVLPDYKSGTKIAYQSYYKPNSVAIDTFATTIVDSIGPYTFTGTNVVCNKSLFKALQLPFDAGTYNSEAYVEHLWDGNLSPRGWPNIYHSSETQLPHLLTFDMGKIYFLLKQFEIIGRDCCHNPLSFEVWGIGDITNAATTVGGGNSGWKDQMLAKGWTLMADVNRTGDGKDPYKIDLNVPEGTPIRYIRMRTKTVASGSTNSSNFSQVTFWNKQ